MGVGRDLKREVVLSPHGRLPYYRYRLGAFRINVPSLPATTSLNHPTANSIMEDPQSPSTETPNQRQARLRRERREAKLKAEGTSRLEKITKVSGRQNLPGTFPPPPDPRPPQLSS